MGYSENFILNIYTYFLAKASNPINIANSLLLGHWTICEAPADRTYPTGSENSSFRLITQPLPQAVLPYTLLVTAC